MKKALSAVILLLAAIPLNPAFAQEQYICIGEKATGFKWDESRKSWEIVRFNARGDKFLVQRINPTKILGKTYNFEVREFGRKDVRHRCERFETMTYEHPLINCGGIGFGMWINTETLRYQEVYGLGYIDGKDDTGNTPSLTIGTCTRVN